MAINERIKALRKELGLTQKDFSEKIGIKRNTLSYIESGNSTVTDSNIKLICEKFNINETWLRTGEGEKERRDDNTLLKKFLEHGNSKDKAFIEVFLSMPDDAREAVISFVEESAARFKTLETQYGYSTPHNEMERMCHNNRNVSDEARTAIDNEEKNKDASLLQRTVS